MPKILIVENSPDNMKQPVLVLMDIQLPGKDGFALLSEIRRSSHAGLRVLASTAPAMHGDRERALEAGFDGYITKPIDIEGSSSR